jgi:hypothetical protein
VKRFATKKYFQLAESWDGFRFIQQDRQELPTVVAAQHSLHLTAFGAGQRAHNSSLGSGDHFARS